MTATDPALIAEATRRSGVVWVGAEGAALRAVWHLWRDDRMFVVGGGLEQRLPEIGPGRQAVVAVRSKDRQGDLVVEWTAMVDRLEPGSAEWAEVVPLLHAKRLNAPDGEAQPARWARESTVLRFTPTS